jgi:hypothetical protein
MTGELEVAQLRQRVISLEGKVAYLYKHLGIPFAAEPLSSDDPRIIEQLKKKNLLGAMKIYRQIYDTTADAAKQAVEEMQGRLGL